MLPPLSTPQFHHDLACCHNWEGDDGEESDQDKDWGGVCCKCNSRRYGWEQKAGKKNGGAERGDGMCPVCGGEEEVPR